MSSVTAARREGAKKVVVVVEKAAFNEETTTEAVRMAVALPVSESLVTLVFLGAGVRLLGQVDERRLGRRQLGQHLVVLGELKVRMVAEQGALEAAGLISRADQLGVEVLSLEETDALMGGADVLVRP